VEKLASFLLSGNENSRIVLFRYGNIFRLISQTPYRFFMWTPPFRLRGQQEYCRKWQKKV